MEVAQYSHLDYLNMPNSMKRTLRGHIHIVMVYEREVAAFTDIDDALALEKSMSVGELEHAITISTLHLNRYPRKKSVLFPKL